MPPQISTTLPTPRVHRETTPSCATCGPGHCEVRHERIERGARRLMGEAALFADVVPAHLLVTARIVLASVSELECCPQH